MAEATVGLLRVVLASNSAEFQRDMGKASTSVEGFDKTAKNAGKSLAAMVSSFDGTKAAAEANKVAQAVNQVGGASKLTEQELGRVRATLDATIAKFNTMGREVPADIQKVRNEITQLDQAAAQTSAPTGGIGQWGGALSMVSRILPGLSVAGAVAGITSLARSALEAADKFVTLSEKTGASIETVQRWDYVAEQTGTTVEAFGNNAFKLGINVAAGTDKVRSAIGSLGIAYEELRSLKPEDQFALVIEKLEGVESVTERNRLGQILFGRQFAEIATAVSEGYTRIASEASVAGEAQVRAAEAAGDAWDRLKSKIAAVALGAVGRVAQELLDTAASLDTLNEAEMQAFTVAQRLGEGHLYLVSLQRERVKGQRDITLAVQEGAAADADYVARLAAIRAEVSALSGAQKTQLNAALKLGSEAATEYAETIGLSEAALRLYQQGSKESTKATSELTREHEKAARELERFWQQVERLGKDSIPNLTLQMSKWETVAKDHVTLVDMTAAGYAKARVEAEQWALKNGAVLAPSIKAVSTVITEETPKWSSLFQSFADKLPNIILGAVQGGGSAIKSAGVFAGNELGSFLSTKFGEVLKTSLPFGLGAAINAMLPMLGSLFGPLLSKIGNLFRNLFGGPSGDELAGRALVETFEESLHGTLTAQQEAESQGQDWARTVIAIRDAYIAMGRTEEEALRDADRLWESSRQSAEESARVIAEIQRKMRELTGETQTIDIEVVYRTTAPPGATRPGDPESHTQPVDFGFASGTMGRFGEFFRNFGSGFSTRLHGVEAVLRPQDALPFARQVIAGMTPGQPEAAGATNSINILPVLMGSGMSSRDIAREAANHIAKSGLEMNEGGITSAIENVFHNLMLSYYSRA